MMFIQETKRLGDLAARAFTLHPRRREEDVMAAPEADVTIPTRRGSNGNGRFSDSANNPSA